MDRGLDTTPPLPISPETTCTNASDRAALAPFASHAVHPTRMQATTELDLWKRELEALRGPLQAHIDQVSASLIRQRASSPTNTAARVTKARQRKSSR